MAEDKKEGEATDKKEDGAATPMSVEDLGKQIASIQENLNMLMEAFAVMMEGQAPADAAPSDEAKGDEEQDADKKEGDAEVEDKEDDEMTEEEMEKELEKTIAELESIEKA